MPTFDVVDHFDTYINNINTVKANMHIDYRYILKFNTILIIIIPLMHQHFVCDEIINRRYYEFRRV